jgi:hypothetical protein
MRSASRGSGPESILVLVLDSPARTKDDDEDEDDKSLVGLEANDEHRRVGRTTRRRGDG